MDYEEELSRCSEEAETIEDLEFCQDTYFENVSREVDDDFEDMSDEDFYGDSFWEDEDDRPW